MKPKKKQQSGAERKAFIQAATDFAEDFSDGAFFAYMEEQGIDVTELE